MSLQTVDITLSLGVSGFRDPDMDDICGLRVTRHHVSLHITAEVWP